MRLVALPAYIPNFNADETVWEWGRDEATANTCFSTRKKLGKMSMPSSSDSPATPMKSSVAATLCCNSWPTPGQGGLAELRPASPPPGADAATSTAYTRLQSLTTELDKLRDAGAALRYPARMANAERTVVRIRRGLAGGLVEDAELDLDRLKQQLHMLAELQAKAHVLLDGKA